MKGREVQWPCNINIDNNNNNNNFIIHLMLIIHVAPNFRYYAMNSSIRTIPTATHEFPNGGAIHQLTNMLQQRKERGIAKLGQECQRERKRPGHKYIGNYPCEKSDKI